MAAQNIAAGPQSLAISILKTKSAVTFATELSILEYRAGNVHSRVIFGDRCECATAPCIAAAVEDSDKLNLLQRRLDDLTRYVSCRVVLKISMMKLWSLTKQLFLKAIAVGRSGESAETKFAGRTRSVHYLTI